MRFNKFQSFLYILITIISFGFRLSAQDQTLTSPEYLARALNQALIARNENQLMQLLHPDLTYGHSNGWVENKKTLLLNNQSKYLIYEKIAMDSMHVIYYKDVSILRFQATHDIVLDGKSLSLKLHVCQTWVKAKGKWKLLARQSTKLI